MPPTHLPPPPPPPPPQKKKKKKTHRYAGERNLSRDHLTHRFGFGLALYKLKDNTGVAEVRAGAGVERNVELLRRLVGSKGPTEVNTERESECWEPRLDGHGAFVGLYSNTVRRDQMPPVDEHYVAVAAGAGDAGHRFYAHAEAEVAAETSFRAFAADPMLQAMRNLGRRNRGRIAAEFAAVNGLNVACSADALSYGFSRERNLLVTVTKNLWEDMVNCYIAGDMAGVESLCEQQGFGLRELDNVDGRFAPHTHIPHTHTPHPSNKDTC